MYFGSAEIDRPAAISGNATHALTPAAPKTQPTSSSQNSGETQRAAERNLLILHERDPVAKAARCRDQTP
jgi:hypothetical protein